MRFDPIETAIEDIRQGKFVIVADDEGRENEGDLVCAAELITPEMINFMTKFGRGLICVALTPDRADELGLPLMTEENTDPQGTAFTISVDAHQPSPGVCRVGIIPFTWDHTNLRLLEPGAPVNLEGDLIGKHVGKMLAAREGASHNES